MVAGKVKGVALGVIGVIIAFIVVFFIVGGTAPALIDASDNISGSGLPLANLFASNGVLLLIFMIALFVAMIVLAFRMFGGKK